MSSEETRMQKARRAARIARIIERCQQLDDQTLEVMDRMTADVLSGAASSEEPIQVDRRRFLNLAALGGAVIVAGGSGIALWRSSERRAADLEEQMAALQENLTRYEQVASTALELAALDQEVANGLATIDGRVEQLYESAAEIRSAAGETRTVLRDTQSRLHWLRQNQQLLSERLLALEDEVNPLLELTGTVDETIEPFLAAVLDALPAGTAGRMDGSLQQLGQVIALLPALTEGLTSRILEPLEEWLDISTQVDANADPTPLVVLLLEPVEALADDLLALPETLEQELVTPLEDSLRQQQTLRQQIIQLQET